jgi:hypothetical protein
MPYVDSTACAQLKPCLKQAIACSISFMFDPLSGQMKKQKTKPNNLFSRKGAKVAKESDA